MTSGQKISAACERAGVSQAELARRMGVTRQQVGWWTSEKNTPLFQTWERIASALDMDIVELLGIGDEKGVA